MIYAHNEISVEIRQNFYCKTPHVDKNQAETLNIRQYATVKCYDFSKSYLTLTNPEFY